jgi:cytidine deaminase
MGYLDVFPEDTEVDADVLLQTSGHKSFKAIAVATDIVPGASPCGMCRQLCVFFSIPFKPTLSLLKSVSSLLVCANSARQSSRFTCMTRKASMC